MRTLLSLAIAIIGAIAAMFLVGLLGYLLCFLIVWITGDQSRWQLMWLVYASAVITLHVAFPAILVVEAYREKKREQDQRKSRGFSVGRIRDEEGD